MADQDRIGTIVTNALCGCAQRKPLMVRIEEADLVLPPKELGPDQDMAQGELRRKRGARGEAAKMGDDKNAAHGRVAPFHHVLQEEAGPVAHREKSKWNEREGADVGA